MAEKDSCYRQMLRRISVVKESDCEYYYPEKIEFRNPISIYHKVQGTKTKFGKQSKSCKSVNPQKKLRSGARGLSDSNLINSDSFTTDIFLNICLSKNF